ncbi:DJ-1/PfpI family protein [Kitasatospora sp. NPDC001159]
MDTLVAVGGGGVHRACEDRAFVDWFARTAHRARRTASVCSGAFLLGAAGLLDGRRAVTHWASCGQLAGRYPQATVDPDPLFIRDGELWVLGRHHRRRTGRRPRGAKDYLATGRDASAADPGSAR